MIAITETKFTEASVALLSDYQLFRSDRKAEHPGGGVCLYIREGLAAIEVDIDQLKTDKFEQIWRIVKTKRDSVLVGCIYRPPSSTNETNESINRALAQAEASLSRLGCSTLIITGDFNLPLIKYTEIDVGGHSATIGRINSEGEGDKRPAHAFLTCLEENHLTQMITFPTYRHSIDREPENTLDFVITNEPDRVFEPTRDSPLGHTPQGRAHFVLRWSLLMLNGADTEKKVKERFVWSKANFDKISDYISSVN